MVIDKLRLDRWLWRARIAKTRTLCATLIETGKCRVNGQLIKKPATKAAVGDVLTLTYGPGVRVLRIVSLGLRRGPAAEAQELYRDLDVEVTSNNRIALER